MRTFTCVDCGATTTRARSTNDPLICLDCGIDRMIAQTQQMHRRKGPYYERWKLSAGPAGRPRQPTTVE